MPDRPPVPPSPTGGPSIRSDLPRQNRIVVTTAQLSSSLHKSFGCQIDDSTLDELLLELDRKGFVEWVTISPSGDHVWDLTDSPEKLGEAIANILIAHLRTKLASTE